MIKRSRIRYRSDFTNTGAKLYLFYLLGHLFPWSLVLHDIGPPSMSLENCRRSSRQRFSPNYAICSSEQLQY